MSTLSLKRKPAPVPEPTSVPSLPLTADSFFILWRLHGKKGHQACRHATMEAAIAERDRLKKLNPGQRYFIFECFRRHEFDHQVEKSHE